jgi:hypothetical protein
MPYTRLERGLSSSLGNECCSVDRGGVMAINATVRIGALGSR